MLASTGAFAARMEPAITHPRGYVLSGDATTGVAAWATGRF
jgi:hypothetical protein